MQKPSYNIQTIDGKQVITEVNTPIKHRIGIAKPLIMLILAVSVFSAGRVASQYRITEDYSIVPVSYYSQVDVINHYNAGFRSGAMDRLASLVECDGVTDQNVLRDYSATAEVLINMGELDSAPYPCTE
jgi:hypothetical protein